MREIYAAAVDPSHPLTDEALDASLEATIAARPADAGWWVFAYGSLLWNPLFPFMEAVPAMLPGLHRSFCLWSRASRGTAHAPGLVLGLVPGGCCHGVAYRLPDDCARDELKLLWRREMVLGAYRPRWLRVRVDTRFDRKRGTSARAESSRAPSHAARAPTLTALAFVVDRKHAQYTGELSVDDQIRVIATARGAFGSTADYLERARIALITHGIVDSYLEKLAAGVGARQSGAQASLATSPRGGRRRR